MNFWQGSLLDQLPASFEVKFVAEIIILLFAVLLFARKPTALVMYLFGTIGLLTFFYEIRFGAIRHWGFLFMLFIAVLWVSNYCKDLTLPKQTFGKQRFEVIYRLIRFKRDTLYRVSLVLEKSLNGVLTFMLIIHVIGGVAAATMDCRVSFSEGKAVARFIKESKLDGMIIAPEAPDDVTLEILGYLEKDRFYYPRTRRFGSFIPWDRKWAIGRGFHTEDVLREIQGLSDAKREDILVISGRVYSEGRLKYGTS